MIVQGNRIVEIPYTGAILPSLPGGTRDACEINKERPYSSIRSGIFKLNSASVAPILLSSGESSAIASRNRWLVVIASLYLCALASHI